MESKQENACKPHTLATCPACGLLCDDIQIELSADISSNPADKKNVPLKVLNSQCAKSVQFFEQQMGEKSPQVNGKNVDVDQAILHAATLLKTSKKPLFAGLSTDVHGFRAIYKLATKTNGSLQHMNASSLARNMAVLQNSGWQTTTLGEVKNRADVIVCIGTDIVSHNARFFERFIWLSNAQSGAMFTETDKREVIYIGENLNTSAGISPDGRQPISVHCSHADLPEILAVLRTLIAGKKLKAKHVAGISTSDLQAIANKLKQANYAVLAWIAKDLDFPHAELTIQSITETVALLNSQTSNTGRAACLALGGSDGDTSANHANTWLSGFSLTDDEADYDALVWIDSFDLKLNTKKRPKNSAVPFIVLGNPNSTFEQIPDVFIPVATPGLDCNGTLFRVDSSVILPLKQVRANQLPTLADIARRIEASLVDLS